MADAGCSASAANAPAGSRDSSAGASNCIMAAASTFSAASTFFVVRRVRFGFSVVRSTGTSAGWLATTVGSSATTSAVAFRVRRLGFSVAGSALVSATAGSAAGAVAAAALRVRRLGVSGTDAESLSGVPSAVVVTVASTTALFVVRRFFVGAACSSVGCAFRVGIDGSCSGKTDRPSVRQIVASS